jgi:hypothetical protein
MYNSLLKCNHEDMRFAFWRGLSMMFLCIDCNKYIFEEKCQKLRC